MTTTTVNLGLHKYDPATDGNSTFDVVKALNEPYDKLDAVIPLSNMARQAIINGQFDVWQRGTSFTNPANLQYTADRYMWASVPDGGTNPALTHSRLTLTSGEIPGSYYGYRINSNGAGASYGANSLHWLSQQIEFGTRYLCGNGKKVTVSIWARSDVPGKKLGIWLRQTYGTGGTPSASEVINGANWTLNGVWSKYSFTFTTNTLSGKAFGSANNDTLEVAIAYQWGTALASRVGASTAETFGGVGNIDIAQVQLCAGDVALPFQPRSFAEELALCQRYYQTGFQYRANGEFVSNSRVWMTVPFLRSMRTTPTLVKKTDLVVEDVGSGTATSTQGFFGTGSGGNSMVFTMDGFSVNNMWRAATLVSDSIALDAEM